ncbi:MAG: DoxX family membrane protein [Bacteroidales bacterium]|nr:DoxX family membrane protein [Bacteroidales bacterium]
MKKISLPRVFSVVAGIAFLLSGFMKLPDVSGFQNLIIQYGFPYLNYLAPLIILLEILLGMALVLGVFQRGTAIASIIVLFFFSQWHILMVIWSILWKIAVALVDWSNLLLQ